MSYLNEQFPQSSDSSRDEENEAIRERNKLRESILRAHNDLLGDDIDAEQEKEAFAKLSRGLTDERIYEECADLLGGIISYRKHYPERAKKAFNILEEHIGTEDHFAENCLKNILEFAVNDLREEADGIIMAARRVLTTNLRDKRFFGYCAPVLERILDSSYSDHNKVDEQWALTQFDKNFEIFKDNLDSTRGDDTEEDEEFVYVFDTRDRLHFEASTKIFIQLLNYPQFDLEKRATSVIEEIIGKFGLDGKKVFKDWVKSFSYAWENKPNPYDPGRVFSRREDFSRVIKNNLDTVRKLELSRPGAAKYLSEQFGIADFGRYFCTQLIKQYDERNDISSKYGIIIYPKADWNGAFYNNGYILDKTSDALKEKGILTRIVECGNTVRVYGILSKLNEKYNIKGGNKIMFAIVGGHGTSEFINFGDEGSYRARELRIDNFLELTGRVRLSDLQNYTDKIQKGTLKARYFFADDPSIVLFSCSTGALSGIGQKISGAMGAKVNAPNSPSYIKDMNVYFDGEGKPVFKVDYSDDSKTAYNQGKFVE